ncbi:MAG: PEP-CTERM sorting domain-containing protein [Prosthecobacter sp.]|jgi:hypothetical protein
MSLRSLLYWIICLSFAVFVAQAAEPASAEWTGAEGLQNKLLPVPEPGRAMLLFAGVMAMAFTYRRAWLNWKTGPQA